MSSTLVIIEPEELRAIVREEMRARCELTPWINVASAATYLDTSEDAIRALVKRDAIPSHRTPTGRRLFRREELDEWVARGDLRFDG